MTRSLAALSLFLTAALASAAPLALAPRDIVADDFSQRGRPFVTAATNGNTFIVAWEDRFNAIYDSTASVVVRTYDANGMPEQSLPVPIAAGIVPAVVWNGSDWVLSWRSAVSRFDSFPVQRLFASHISEHATDASPVLEIASTPQGHDGGSGAVTNGHELFIGNYGNAVIATPDLQPRVKLAQPLRPLAAAGETFLGQGNGTAVVLSRDGAIVQNIATSNASAATSNGQQYAIVYAADNSVEALIVGTGGTIINRTTLEANVSASTPAIVRRGDSYLAGWVTAQRNLCFASFNGSAKSAVHCEAATGFVQSLALADNGSQSLVTWSERALDWNVPDHVYTSFGPSSQLPLLRPSVATTMLRPQTQPRLEPDANGLTAVWTDGFTIYLGGLDRGSTLTRAPRAVVSGSDRVFDLRVSRSRNATLVLWTSQPPQGNPQLRVSVIPDDGSPQVDATLGEGVGAEVASDGNEWLAVWPKAGFPTQAVSSIITAQGIVVSPGGTPLVASSFSQNNVAVASRGTDFLVGWTEDRSRGTRLLALGVSTAGTPNGGVLDLAGGPISGVQIAASGRLYLIVVEANNIGFPVTSIIPDILVAGVPDGPFRVRPRDGGFAVLHGQPLRATYVDALGNDFDGGVLPLPAYLYEFDFAYDGPRLVVAHTVAGAWDSRVDLELFGPRVRATGR